MKMAKSSARHAGKQRQPSHDSNVSRPENISTHHQRLNSLSSGQYTREQRLHVQPGVPPASQMPFVGGQRDKKQRQHTQIKPPPMSLSDETTRCKTEKNLQSKNSTPVQLQLPYQHPDAR
ncbi:MAG: hypothetical protein H7839_06790 [Magnetococcus sp. YQC-5]